MRTSSAIREEISNLPIGIRLTRSRVLGAEETIDRLKVVILAGLTVHQGGSEDPDHIGNNAGAVANLAMSPDAQRLVAAMSILELLKGTDEYREAVEKLDPLYAELSEAEAREQAEREALQQAENAVREAKEAARLKAEAALAKDATVKAAQAELERLKAAHPEHVVEPEPVKPTLLETYHGLPPRPEEDIARELQADFK